MDEHSPAAQLPPPPAPPGPPGAPGAPGTLDPAEARARSTGQAALGMVGLGAAVLAARAVDVHLPACPFLALTGVPCPGCGITRLSAAVAGGDLDRALGADPAGVVLLVGLAIVAATYLVQVVVRHRPPPRWLAGPAIPLVLGGLLAAHWVTTLTWGGMLAT